MSDAHAAPARANVSVAALFFGIFAGPAAWSVQTLVNLAVASHGCFPRLFPLTSPVVPGLRGITLAVSVLAVVICTAALMVSVRSWRRTRGEHHQGAGSATAHQPATSLVETGEGRTRFMAMSGVFTSATFAIAILVHLASILVVPPCG
jgi:hypothetical protein